MCNVHVAGTVPSTLGMISSLAKLELAYNHFTGVVPTELGLLSNLEYLELASNHFTGLLPNLELLAKLLTFDIEDNSFSGLNGLDIVFMIDL